MGRVAALVMTSVGLIVTVKVSEAEFEAESVTLAVNVAVPAIGVAPDKTPALDKLRPTAVRLGAPEVTDHV